MIQVEGRNPVYEAVQSDNKISVIYLEGRAAKDPKIREIVSLAHKKGVRIRKTGKNKLDKMSKTKSHQGIIAHVRHEFKTLQEVLSELKEKGKNPFFLIINQVLYQHNLGAMMRSAECAGCTGVIVPLKTKITPDAVRTSMGAIEHIPVLKEALFPALKVLKQEGIRIVGIEANGETTIYEEDLKGPIAIIVGGEHSGITKSILAKCDIVLKIPIFGKINSLNMSNATAVTLFEKVRQELSK